VSGIAVVVDWRNGCPRGELKSIRAHVFGIGAEAGGYAIEGSVPVAVPERPAAARTRRVFCDFEGQWLWEMARAGTCLSDQGR